MCLLAFFMEMPAAAAIKSLIALSSKSRKYCKEGTLTSYKEVICYLLETYDTDYVIANMDGQVLQFTQPSNVTPTEYAEAL